VKQVLNSEVTEDST